MDVEIIVFDGFDEMDAVGPFEVFETGADFGADVAASLVTLSPVETVTAAHGLRVVPDGTLSDPDVVLVPGGGWNSGDAGVRREIERGDLTAAIGEAHDAGAVVGSVCTGAMALAHAGVLSGRPATTHHGAHADLAECARLVEARVVDDGDVLTAGGVTAGLDLALYMLERDCGPDYAERAAREMEYERSGDRYRPE